MFRRHVLARLLSALGAFAMLLPPGIVGEHRLTQNSPGAGLTTVSFRQPVSPREAVEIITAAGALVVGLRHQYTAGTTVWTGGITFGAQSPGRDLVAQYELEHASFVRDLQAAAATGTWAPGSDSSFADAANALSGSVVISAEVLATDSHRETLARQASIDRVRVVQVRRGGSGGKLAAPLQSHVPKSQWVPDDINVDVRDSSQAGYRYVMQTFDWNSGRSIWFGNAGGYEADFYLSANDGTYITTSSTFSIPNVYWTTDLPGSQPWAPYLDSRAGDPSNELAYTVGTPSGHLIQTGRSYYTYIRGYNGTASTDRGKVVPQLYVCTDWANGCDTWTQVSHDACPPGYWPIYIPTPNYYWNRFNNGCT